MVSHELSKPRRIELILRQIDTLPTLPAVATKLLQLTADDDASAKEVTRLIASDPALTARVLSMCKAADKGIRSDVVTIDRAVVLLGFNAIRNAVLSVKVLEVFEGTVDGDLDYPLRGHESPAPGRFNTGTGDDQPATRLDRRGFWLHCLAVAITAEAIARAHRDPDLPADEAFVCGLLHDLGKLALDHVLPRSFGRVVELAELHRGDIAAYERKIVGLDHHTAGKRLAEQWKLPLRLQDAIWLHGSPIETLPRMEHRRLVGLVRLADAVVRGHHVGYSGNHDPADADAMAQQLDLSPEKVRDATAGLFEELETRGRALGIHDEPSHELALASIQRANSALGRANAALHRRSRLAEGQANVLQTLQAFNAAAAPARSVEDVVDGVVASARSLLGDGFYAALCPSRQPLPGAGGDGDTPPPPDGYWLVSQYNDRGEPVDASYRETPPRTPDLAGLDASRSLGVELMGVLPWIADDLTAAADLRDVKLLPLPCGWGTVALLLHDRPDAPTWDTLAPLAGSWGNAIAAAAQHAGAKRLGEDLAAANAALAAAQQRLTHAESLARLGEMAAGAAHEMNNPLAVISGRSQLMGMTLPAGSDHQKSAQMIFREAHRLSDLISCLRLFADPPAADRKPVDLQPLLDGVVKKIRKPLDQRDAKFRLESSVGPGLDAVTIDAGMTERAVTELLFNAVQARPASLVMVKAMLDPAADPDAPVLLIQVTDDGVGMDRRTLDHALDPFFSAKDAGRQVGMGLPRAEHHARAHGGSVRLRSDAGHGTVATLLLPLH